MKTYKVFESANVTFVYEFEAKSKDDAIHKVNQGIVEPKETDFFEYEVMDVAELEGSKE